MGGCLSFRLKEMWRERKVGCASSYLSLNAGEQDKQELVNLPSVAWVPEGNRNYEPWVEDEDLRLQTAPCQQLLSVAANEVTLGCWHDSEPAGAETCGICYIWVIKEDLQLKQVKHSWRKGTAHRQLRKDKIHGGSTRTGVPIWRENWMKCTIRSLDSDSGYEWLWDSKTSSVL